jgi:hypothetical protein
MIPALMSVELAKLASALDDGKCSSTEALELAYALGAETERLDAMHRACEDYSRARSTREEVFKMRAISSRPPGPR